MPGSAGKVQQLERNTPAAVTGIKGKIVQIATSNSDSYALTSTGVVWAWGLDNKGQLGDGSTSPYSAQAVQVRFPAGVKIAAVANPMPFDGALAVDSRSHAWGWGYSGVAPQRKVTISQLMKMESYRRTRARRRPNTCGDGPSKETRIFCGCAPPNSPAAGRRARSEQEGYPR